MKTNKPSQVSLRKKKALGYWVASVLFGTALYSVSAVANEKDNSDTLKKITVTTATKSPVLLEEVPIRTQVVTKEEIRRNHARNLAEALKYVPGLQLEKLHGKEGFGVWIQGMDSERVLILIDGNPLTPSSGNSVDVTQIAVSDVERIEIVKGAMSTLYGAAAMGGVVNVITQEPSDKFRFVADVSGGGWGDQNVKDGPVAKRTGNFELSTKQDKWYAQLVADLVGSDGFKVPGTTGTQGWEGHKNTVSAKFQYQFENDIELTLMPRYYDESATTFKFQPGSGDVPYVDKYTRLFTTAVVEQQKEDLNWKVRAVVEDQKGESDKAAKRETTSKTSQLAGQTAFEINSSHQLTLGAEYTREGLDVVNLTSDKHEVPDKKKTSFDIYAQDSLFVTDSFEVLLGARYNYNDRDMGHLSPTLNTMYSRHDWLPGRVNLRFGVGNGYRTPNLKEQHYLFDHSQIGYVVKGNPDLKPETSINYQFGAEWLFPKQGSFELTAFFNNVKDLIDTSLSVGETYNNMPGVSVYKYQNFEKAELYGAGLVFRSLVGRYIHLDLGYDYLRATDLITKKRLPKRPEHQFKAGMDVFMPADITFSARWNYQSEEYNDESNDSKTPAYGTWGLKFNQDITRGWAWYAGADNVTGEQRVFDGQDFRPEEGRFVYLGVRWELKQP